MSLIENIYPESSPYNIVTVLLNKRFDEVPYHADMFVSEKY